MLDGSWNVTAMAARFGVAPKQLRATARMDPASFWGAVSERFGPSWLTPYERVLDQTAGEPLKTQWFPGGRLNVGEWLLRRDLDPTAVVLRYADETGVTTEVTRAQLDRASAHIANELVARGVAPGDRVGLVASIHWATAVTTLGILRAGAVSVPVFSGYAEWAIEARLTLAEPALTIVQDAAVRNGKRDVIADRGLAPSVRAVAGTSLLLDTSGQPVGERADGMIDAAALLDAQASFESVALPGDAPAFVLTTSGSTGNPKRVTLTHGGFGVQAACEWGLHLDASPGDTVLWPADTAWLVGPWSLLGVLCVGACLTLLGGNPIAAKRNVPMAWSPHILGGSPAFLAKALGGDEAHLHRPPRVVATAGEPLVASRWHLLRDALGPDVPIINMSGGTEVGGCILASLPIDDPAPGAMGGSTLGLDADVIDDDGASVVGAPGHLVCRNEWPGRAADVTASGSGLPAYYERFGIWDQQDLGMHSADDDWFVMGRSDEVMKIAGRRVGPSDVESAALVVRGVSACVSAPMTIDGTSKLICLVVPDGQVDGDLTAAAADAVAAGLGNAFRPAWVGAVTDPPLTSSGKLDRGVLRRWMVGLSADLTDADRGIARLTEGLAARNEHGWAEPAH